MASPFPGMDPYLERHWPDVHASLIFLAKVALQDQLSADLVARSEERLIVEDSAAGSRSQHPDVRVVEHARTGEPTHPASGVAVAEPLILETESEPIRQGFIEILDATSSGRVITAIEFLSPTNKLPGDGRVKYRRKQDECVAARVNLVEIDLTREGERELLAPQSHLPPEYRTAYLACAFRAHAGRLGRKEVYRIPLRERLPAIGIPLRTTDSDVVLDLQDLVERAYMSGRYERTMDYGAACSPPLSPAEAAWADELLRSAGRR